MAKIGINIKEGNVDKKEEVIIGIDLGTTNSCVAVNVADGFSRLVDESSLKWPHYIDLLYN